MAAIIRYLPNRALPPYTYVPGRAPHPVNDPRGHSYRQQSHPAGGATAAGLNRELAHSDEFLWGVDLFNHGYYWEAHEAWESVWNAAGRHGPVAGFVQGLIKLAAAGVKAREGRPAGVHRHTARARELIDAALRELTPSDAVYGLNPDAVLSICDEFSAAASSSFPEDSMPRPIVNDRLQLIGR
jgi:hypothetical protein